MWKEFREFAIRGNVIDMAVGIIVGAAFTAIVTSAVEDLIKGPLGLLTGGLDFGNRFLVLRDGSTAGPYATLLAAREAGAAVIAWGSFVNAVIGFVITAFVLFLIVRWMNRLRRPDTPPAPRTRACPFCTMNIDERATRCPHCTSHLEEAEPATP